MANLSQYSGSPGPCSQPFAYTPAPRSPYDYRNFDNGCFTVEGVVGAANDLNTGFSTKAYTNAKQCCAKLYDNNRLCCNGPEQLPEWPARSGPSRIYPVMDNTVDMYPVGETMEPGINQWRDNVPNEDLSVWPLGMKPERYVPPRQGKGEDHARAKAVAAANRQAAAAQAAAAQAVATASMKVVPAVSATPSGTVKRDRVVPKATTTGPVPPANAKAQAKAQAKAYAKAKETTEQGAEAAKFFRKMKTTGKDVMRDLKRWKDLPRNKRFQYVFVYDNRGGYCFMYFLLFVVSIMLVALLTYMITKKP